MIISDIASLRGPGKSVRYTPKSALKEVISSKYAFRDLGLVP